MHEAVFESYGNSAHGSFDTAWSPPIEFYDHIVARGFDVEAYYHEPGMAFAGAYHTESGDTYIEYDFSDPNWRDGLDETLIEMLEYEYEYYLENIDDTEDTSV